MEKRLLGAGMMLLFAASLGLAASNSATPNSATRTWRGYVTDTYCGFNRVNKPPTAACTLECIKNEHAKYAFFNFADKKVYVLNPQAEAAKYAGQTVVVQGVMGGHERFDTGKGPGAGAIINASSITPEASK